MTRWTSQKSSFSVSRLLRLSYSTGSSPSEPAGTTASIGSFHLSRSLSSCCWTGGSGSSIHCHGTKSYHGSCWLVPFHLPSKDSGFFGSLANRKGNSRIPRSSWQLASTVTSGILSTHRWSFWGGGSFSRMYPQSVLQSRWQISAPWLQRQRQKKRKWSMLLEQSMKSTCKTRRCFFHIVSDDSRESNEKE